MLEKVLSCPFVCLSNSLQALNNENGIDSTPVWPISKSPAVTGLPFVLDCYLCQPPQISGQFLFSLILHICLKYVAITSLSCWMQRKRMVYVIYCNVIAILLVLGCRVLSWWAPGCDLIRAQDFGFRCKNISLSFTSGSDALGDQYRLLLVL